jgi:membrane protease YdiL (CAAX protease family)
VTEPPTGPDGDTPTENAVAPVAGEGLDDGDESTAAPSDPGGVPPGASVFSLDRPASGLYLVAWLLTGLGLATVFVGVIATTAGGPLAFAGLLTATIGLAAACGYQVVSRRVTRPRSAYRGPSPLLAFFAAAILSSCLVVVLGLAGLLGRDPGTDFLLGLVVVAAGYLAIVIFFVVRTGALSWTQMGWPVGPRRIERLIGDAAFGLIVTVPVVVPVLVVAGILAAVLDVQPTARIPTVEGALATAFVILGAAVVAPIAEEMFFRGYALSAWQRDLGPRPALVRSAIFFAFVHIANVSGVTFGDAASEAVLQVAVIVPLGFVLGWVYQRHGIGASIAGHVGYNSTLLVLAALAGQLGALPA